jgi:hypothetical protein
MRRTGSSDLRPDRIPAAQGRSRHPSRPATGPREFTCDGANRLPSCSGTRRPRAPRSWPLRCSTRRRRQLLHPLAGLGNTTHLLRSGGRAGRRLGVSGGPHEDRRNCQALVVGDPAARQAEDRDHAQSLALVRTWCASSRRSVRLLGRNGTGRSGRGTGRSARPWSRLPTQRAGQLHETRGGSPLSGVTACGGVGPRSGSGVVVAEDAAAISHSLRQASRPRRDIAVAVLAWAFG